VADATVALSPPELLDRAHDLSPFSCGKPALDLWLKTRALSNQEKGFTVVMVVHDQGRVVGYYGLAPSAVLPAAVPRSIRTGQPPNPVPCLLLGQLATDQASAGRGIGTGLLRHALIRCVAGARLIGGRALLVKAIDEEAASFWNRRGFLPSKDDPLTLFRSLPDIAAALKAARIEVQAPPVDYSPRP
jgi:GNAT superfamily N-acetyltransferase